MDAPIAPRGIFSCQAQDEAADRGDRARTPGPTALACTGVADFHQVAMPSQHRVRADQQSESAQRRAGQGREQGREQRPVLGLQLWALIAKLSVQDRELMA
jgi:ribosomal protein L19E